MNGVSCTVPGRHNMSSEGRCKRKATNAMTRSKSHASHSVIAQTQPWRSVVGSEVTAGTTQSVLDRLLDEGGLILEDLQSLLEACNLSLALCLPLSIWLCLGNTHLLELVQSRCHRSKLILHTRQIGGELSHSLVKACGLLGLVLHILLLLHVGNFILLAVGFVFCHSSLLCSSHLGESLGEVRLAHLEETNDSAAGAFRGAVALVSLRVVFLEDLECHLHTLDALLHLCAVLVIRCLFLPTERISLSLGLCHACKLTLKSCHLLLELFGGRCLLVDLCGEALTLRGQLIMLGSGLRHLLVTVGLLGCIFLCFGLQCCNHVSDEALHLGEWITTELHCRGHARGKLSQCWGVGLAGQIADEADSLDSGQVRAGGDLHEGVALASSTTGVLLDDLLGSGESIE